MDAKIIKPLEFIVPEPVTNEAIRIIDMAAQNGCLPHRFVVTDTPSRLDCCAADKANVLVPFPKQTARYIFTRNEFESIGERFYGYEVEKEQ